MSKSVKIVKGKGNYVVTIREDFSLFVCPEQMVRLAAKNTSRDDIDRSNTAEKGFIISSLAKRKIRSAAYSLYCRATRKEQLNLRFVTFTFPPLPLDKQSLSVQEQDKFLHKLFKKFIDNERKEGFKGFNGTKTKLDSWLWVNERQDGERLKGIADARNVLHYHCLFRYSSSVDYWTCNIRWLNLLLRNGFEIFNKAFLSPVHKKVREELLGYLKDCNYRKIFEIRSKLKIIVWRVEKGHKTESVFLQPVDFDKKPILSPEHLGKYLSAYITSNEGLDFDSLTDEQRALLKVHARRWGSSRGLVIQKEEINEKFTDLLPKHLFDETNSDITVMLDESTGELIEIDVNTLKALNKHQLIKMYRFDKQAYIKKFELEISGLVYECFYFPPCFKLWAQQPDLKSFFKNAFNYTI